MPIKFNAPVEINVDKLLLDEKNPRIPREKRFATEGDLVAYVAEEYFALAVARSIAAHQFFPSEPLIAVPASRAGHFTVVEGNRRLAALKLLLHPELRDKLVDRGEWDSLPLENVPKKVPVVQVARRRDVAPIIGYRHISGIQPWDAHAKARYIADQIESGLSFKQTAAEVGESEPEVRMNYRNYRISEQAVKLDVDAEALDGMKNGFGVFTRAMQSGNIRDFIGAPAPDKVTMSKTPIPANKKGALKEMVQMLFGPTAVLGESRDITKLGKVVASAEGLKVLRQEKNLEEALIASGGIRDRLVNRLVTAGRNLRAARDDLPTYKKDKEVRNLVDEAAEAVDDLKSIK